MPPSLAFYLAAHRNAAAVQLSMLSQCNPLAAYWSAAYPWMQPLLQQQSAGLNAARSLAEQSPPLPASPPSALSTEIQHFNGKRQLLYGLDEVVDIQLCFLWRYIPSIASTFSIAVCGILFSRKTSG